MLETGTSGLMSGDEKRGDVSASVPALVLDSTTKQTGGCPFASGHSKVGNGHLLTLWLDRPAFLILYHQRVTPCAGLAKVLLPDRCNSWRARFATALALHTLGLLCEQEDELK